MGAPLLALFEKWRFSQELSQSFPSEITIYSAFYAKPNSGQT